MATKNKPVPAPTSITQEFSERAERASLSFPACEVRGPTLLTRGRSASLHVPQLEWRAVSGRGTVYSFSVVHTPPAGFEGGRAVCDRLDRSRGGHANDDKSPEHQPGRRPDWPAGANHFRAPVRPDSLATGGAGGPGDSPSLSFPAPETCQGGSRPSSFVRRSAWTSGSHPSKRRFGARSTS